MVLLWVLAVLKLLGLIAIASVKSANVIRRGSDEVHCADDNESQLVKGAAAEINWTTQQSCHEVHKHHRLQDEQSCGSEDEHPTAPTLQNMCEGASQYDDDTGNNTLDQVLQPGSSAATTGRHVLEPAENNRELQHHHFQDEKSRGRENEHPEAPMLQNMHEGASQHHDDTGNNTLDQILQLGSSAATTGRRAPEPAENNRELRESREEQRRREREAEEMKSSSKFSYFSTGISVAGIISIFSGYLGDQTGHAHTVPLKVCTFFMLATFVSGASMLLLILLRLGSRISIKFFRTLKYATLVLLTLSVFSVSILFLKMFVILAFVPALFVVVIAFIMAWHPCSHH